MVPIFQDLQFHKFLELPFLDWSFKQFQGVWQAVLKAEISYVVKPRMS